MVNLYSAWHHYGVARQLDQDGVPPARPATAAVLLALFLALVGLAMAVYLVSTHQSHNAISEITGTVEATWHRR
jgi:hypothetical protein